MSRPVELYVWLKGDGKCYWPGCNKDLIVEVEGEHILDGHLAHIEGVKKKAPRYNSKMTKKEYNTYGNIMFFCNPHHQIVDFKQIDKYPPDKLKKMKTDHEDIVNGLKRKPNEVQKLESVYATFQVIGGHKSHEAQKQWLEDERNKKRIKDWLYFQTVWYKDLFSEDYRFYDWRTTGEINNIVNLGLDKVSELCHKIEAVEKDTNDSTVEKWRIKMKYYERFDGDEVFE